MELDYPATWQQFRAWFPDEQACIAYLARLRWPNGFHCPKCSSEKGWCLPDGRWTCALCARKVSVTAGTIFDRSRVPLADWFTAIWFMTNQKHGVSALGLQRLLGLGRYQTAWTMLRKLRAAMVRPGRERLQGTVEVDETYVGGIEQGTRGRGTERKFIVAIAIEVLSPIGFGRVRLKRVADASSRSLIPFVQFAIEPGSQVRTDGWKGYAGLAKEGYEHHAVSISSWGRSSACGHAGCSQDRIAAETLDAGNASRFSHRHASGCIPGRVRFSLQPQEIAPSGNALLSLAGECRRYTANEVSAFKSQPNTRKTQHVVATVLRQLPHFLDFGLIRACRLAYLRSRLGRCYLLRCARLGTERR